MSTLHERANGFATLSNYPVGLMNVCVCGQVVLAPLQNHPSCEVTHTY